jgi:hypothetical protein
MEEIKVVHYQLGGKKSPPLEHTTIEYVGSELFITRLVKNFDESFRAEGEVFNDNRFIDGEFIRTSRIESIDWVKRELKTLNTLYKIRM